MSRVPLFRPSNCWAARALIVAVCLTVVSLPIVAQPTDREQLRADLARFQDMYKNTPEDPAVNHDLGVVLELLGRPGPAARFFRRALFRQPDDGEVLTRLGRCERQIGDLESATRNLEKAVRLAPDNREGWYELGLARSDLGKPAACREAFGKVLTLNPAPAQEAYVRLYLGSVALSEGRRDLALDQQKRLEVIDPAKARSLAELLALGGK